MEYPITTRQAAQAAGVSMQRAQQYARSYGVKRNWSKSGFASRFEWTEDDVQGLIERKGKFGPDYANAQ